MDGEQYHGDRAGSKDPHPQRLLKLRFQNQPCPSNPRESSRLTIAFSHLYSGGTDPQGNIVTEGSKTDLDNITQEPSAQFCPGQEMEDSALEGYSSSGDSFLTRSSVMRILEGTDGLFRTGIHWIASATIRAIVRNEGSVQNIYSFPSSISCLISLRDFPCSCSSDIFPKRSKIHSA